MNYSKKIKSKKLISKSLDRKWIQEDSCYYSLVNYNNHLPYILFDYDDTLAEKFTSNPLNNIKSKLLSLVENHNIVIFTNQMGISKNKNSHQHLRLLFNEFTTKLENIPIHIFYAINDDIYRKPMIGMYQLFIKVLKPKKILYYCGDAGGRIGDFSITDLYFANNCGIQYFTPEQIFNESNSKNDLAKKNLKSLLLYKDDIWFDGLLQNKRPILPILDINNMNLTLDIPNKKKILVIMVGSQAIGKSSLSNYLSKKYKLSIINGDKYKTKSKMIKQFNIDKLDSNYNGIIIDNTNPTIENRKQWIDLLDNNTHWTTSIIYLDNCKQICLHLIKYRQFFGGPKIPSVAVHKYYKNLEIPNKNEVDNIYYLNSVIYDNKLEFNHNLRFI